jgi:hypothetical protein
MCAALGYVRFGPIADIQDLPRPSLSRISEELTSAWQNDPNFCEFARLCIDFD